MLPLPASDELTRELIEALPDALVVVDASGHIVAVNGRTEALLGYPRESLLGQPVELLVPGRFREQHEQQRARFDRSPQRRPMAAGRELTARHRDGHDVSVQIGLSPLLSRRGWVVVLLRETPQYLQALRAAEERYRSAIEQAPDAVFVADLDGHYVEVNSAACHLLGYTRDELLDRSITDLIPPEDVPKLGEARSRLLKPGEVQVAEWTLLRKDGSKLPVEISAKIHPDGRWQAFVRDISERRRSQERAARALRELENVLASIPDPVAIRVGEVFAYANPALLRVLGYDDIEQLVGRRFLDSVHPDHRRAADQLLTEHGKLSRSEPLEVQLLARDGSSVALELPPPLSLSYHDEPATLIVAYDRREWKRLQAALGERDRLATVGALAAGVGHEINNPLQHVTMNLELMESELRALDSELPQDKLSELGQLVQDAQAGAERIRKIVRGLHTFARGEREEPAELSLAAVLELSLNLTRNEYAHHVRVETDFGPTPSVYCDESRLAQVFINLITNAAQAMARRPRGSNTLRIATWTDARGRAVAEVRDTGPGMAPDVRAHIFEPFFTTQPVGRGTGLGLAIAHSIVSSLGGLLECESQIGHGSAFRVVLPASDLGPSVTTPRHSAVTPMSRRGRLLVVEDDPIVASLLVRVLGHEHEVERVEDGQAALERLAQRSDYDLVLCDLMMPRMSGMQLFERVRQTYPRLSARFVFMTGGATAPVQEFLESVTNEKLAKPFSVPALHAVVARALGRVQPGPSALRS